MPNRQITETINHLRQLTQVNLQDRWHYCRETLEIDPPLTPPFEGGERVTQPEFWSSCHQWPIAPLNEKGHIAWPENREVIWLTQRFLIPADLQGYPLSGFSLRLALLWWAEDAQIFLNGQLVGQGDLFDCNVRILLSSAVVTGQEINLALRLVSPGHDPGALVRSRLIYEPADSAQIDPGFVADELTILCNYINTYASDRPELIDSFTSQLKAIDWSAVNDREAFHHSLASVREYGRSLLLSLPNIPDKIFLLGHAHLDMAWLWPISETWSAAQRTFASVLNLMSEFPELTFCHSTAALYEWIEINRPDLFAAIKQQVETGRWEIVAGLWVEPELNIISGESIVRQLLYGQRYCLAKFGRLAPLAWLPDSFGFCWQLPQLFQQAGIEYFVTQKLRWNDTTEFPYGIFWWESPDGSRIFSFMSAPIGQDINPVEMAVYAQDWCRENSRIFPTNPLWLPGVGDHGGGPTRDMLEVAEKWQNSPFLPQLEFTTAQKYLQGLSEKLSTTNLPIWRDELYLEYHRGCYTTYAKQKQWNRRCEDLLYQAELFGTLANIISDRVRSKGFSLSPSEVSSKSFSLFSDEKITTNDSGQGLSLSSAEALTTNNEVSSKGFSLSSAEALTTNNEVSSKGFSLSSLEGAWKQVLFNQFHDILPGSSIPEVYLDANHAWSAAQQVATEILATSLRAIAERIALPTPPSPDAQPIVIFNSLNWVRSQVVAVKLPSPLSPEGSWQIYDSSGTEVRSQLSENQILFEAEEIPSIGYRLFWLVPQVTPTINSPQFPDSYILENQLIRAIVDPETGNFSSIFDKINQREVLREPGNQLQAFEDSGQYWDAWNIDPNYAQKPLKPPTLTDIQWLECGPIQWRIRVVRQIGRSQFIQDYILTSHSPILNITTTVDWHEAHVMVKAAFPLNIEADPATYEMPCGAIERSTKPQTPPETAKWEVPALRWADLTAKSPDVSYGVSLLNNCKYGYDAQANQLRLTLLRGSTWPDPAADFYQHQFTYAIYPHDGSWQSAQTVRRGYELNLPLSVVVLDNSQQLNSDKSEQILSVSGSFLDLSADNLILMAFKPAEDGAEDKKWILRCYECHGETAKMELHSDLGLKVDRQVDLLERAISPNSGDILPWKVTTFQLKSGS